MILSFEKTEAEFCLLTTENTRFTLKVVAVVGKTTLV